MENSQIYETMVHIADNMLYVCRDSRKLCFMSNFSWSVTTNTLLDVILVVCLVIVSL